MSYFQRPRGEGEEPTGHDVEQATVEAPVPHWAPESEEQDAGSWSDIQDAEPWAQDEPEDERSRVGIRMTDLRHRVRGALAGLDLGQVARPTFTPGTDPQATQPWNVLDAVPEAESGPASSRFAVAPLGYNRPAVDEHIAALEAELAHLRAAETELPISVTEEIERLGEQTASILVVAHDKAHETTRLAREQAERCVSDAAENAVTITEQAKRRLDALDVETDIVWQERARLLEDARAVATELVALVDRAESRFPEELKTADVEG